MAELYRFGVSLEKGLIESFDRHIKVKGYTNRSEAIRDLIRSELVAGRWEEEEAGEVAGAITLIYNHHQRELGSKLTDIQHRFQQAIISTQHIHLDADNCMEIVAVRGNPDDVRALADILVSVKGVKHGTLNMTVTGKDLP